MTVENEGRRPGDDEELAREGGLPEEEATGQPAEADQPAGSDQGAGPPGDEPAGSDEPARPAAAEPAPAPTPGADDPIPEAETPGDEAVSPEEPLSAEAPPAERMEEPGQGVPEEVADPDVPAQAPGGQATAETSEAAPKPAASRRDRRGRKQKAPAEEQEAVPGADLEPDLVLDEPSRGDAEDEYGDATYAARYAEPETEAAEPEIPATEAQEEREPGERPSPRSPMGLAADARYMATGKRKTSVARVIVKPGSGTYTINGRTLDEFFPRHGLRNAARQPLVAAGYETRMDVVARLHGGGVSSQAGALRHGVARALADADPSLRGELKRRGYLTRDPRAKERKKAGLKKARKRPQFSKR